MDTLDARVRRVRVRQAELLRRRERAQSAGLLAASALLLGTLVLTIGQLVTPHQVADTDLMASSMLETSTGGYVLVAVLAFMAGVAITAACIYARRREKKDWKTEEKT